jgi:hypothetical protein
MTILLISSAVLVQMRDSLLDAYVGYSSLNKHIVNMLLAVVLIF